LQGALAEAAEIVFSAPTLSDGIRMGNADFVHAVKPRICSFADKGEVVSKDINGDILVHEEGGK